MRIEDKIYKTLKNEIDKSKLKYILLDRLHSAVERLDQDMPVFLQSPEGQTMFSKVVKRLVSEGIISSVGKKPTTHAGLHKKYRIIKDSKSKDNALITEIIRNIDLPSAVDYYIRHPQDFINERDFIKTINDFVKKDGNDVVTINERAYELFSDEKFFKGDERSRGEAILKRLGLNYFDLRCVDTPEPFFSFYRKDFFLKDTRNICIIENKDTFWSFKKNALDSDSVFDIDMLIYGEGKKILSSFQFVEEYDIEPYRDKVYYFGDVDLEGVNIYCELRDKYYIYNILPLCKAYKAIIEIGKGHGLIKTPKQQRVSESNIKKFTHFFDQPWDMEIIKLLEGGFYIPQEALSATRILERFGKS